MRSAKLVLLPVLALALASTSCDESKSSPTAASAQPAATPMPTEPPKPKGPPQFVVDNIGAKVGFSRILLDKPEGPGQLEKELAENKSYIDGKDVELKADRKSKMKAVVMMMSALAKDGATSVTVETETRKEYPGKLKFTPQSLIKNPEPCSVVAMVLDDWSSAVWRLSGTTAIRHSKGLAGPESVHDGGHHQADREGLPEVLDGFRVRRRRHRVGFDLRPGSLHAEAGKGEARHRGAAQGAAGGRTQGRALEDAERANCSNLPHNCHILLRSAR